MGELCDWAGGAVTATPIPKTVAIAKIPAMSRFIANPLVVYGVELVLTSANRLRGEWRFTGVFPSKRTEARLRHQDETTCPIPANMGSGIETSRKIVYAG